MIKLDASGEQVWATQYKNLNVTPIGTASNDQATDMTVDAAGNAYLSDLDGITKLDPSGAKLWYTKSPSYARGNDAVIPNVVRISVAPSGRALFAYGDRDAAVISNQLPLQKWNVATSRPLWIREPGKRHVTIDPVEGVIWDGTFIDSAGLLATDDAVYLMGRYTNAYSNGSTARPATTSAFVARYDLDGKQVWFKQLAVKDGASVTGFNPAALTARPDGNIVLAGNAAGGWLVTTLRANYGSVK